MDPDLNPRELMHITIDDEPVTLPAWLSETLPAIQTYLECVAMKQERVLWSLKVDGIAVDLTDCHQDVGSFQTVEAETIGFKELSNHLMAAGRTKIRDLYDQIAEGSLLVLINEWSVCWRLWREWEPQLREPLLSLRALQELNPKKISPAFEGHAISKMLEELSLIVCETETMFRKGEEDPLRADPIVFSELLEYTLLPWLSNVDQFFSRIVVCLDGSRP